jgi:hypothetical protein
VKRKKINQMQKPVVQSEIRSHRKLKNFSSFFFSFCFRTVLISRNLGTNFLFFKLKQFKNPLNVIIVVKCQIDTDSQMMCK